MTVSLLSALAGGAAGTPATSDWIALQVHKFHSPFAHWVSGLLFEVAAFAGLIALVAALVAGIVHFL